MTTKAIPEWPNGLMQRLHQERDKATRILVLRTAARSILADAVAHREKWCKGPNASAWDAGFVRGMEHAAHVLANSIDRPEL